MPIANVLQSIDIPTFGKPNYRTEDEFIPNSYAMYNAPGGNGYETSVPQEIMIACKGKRRRVVGYLSEGVKLNGVSNWEPIVNTTGISQLNTGLTKANTLGQLGFGGQTTSGGYSTGTGILQPWLNRQFWKGSDPFTLEFNFNLVAETSARDDVYLPAIALLSFCYPRLIDNVEIVENTKNTIDNTFATDMGDGSGRSTVIGALSKSVLNTFATPGPSLMYGAKGNKEGENDNGDAVTIVVGNTYAFGACYLTKVSLEESPNRDYTGYPTWCKCSVSARAMDSNFCSPDGDFMVSQWGDSASDMSDLVEALTVTTETLIKNAANIAKATWNSITAFGSIFNSNKE